MSGSSTMAGRDGSRAGFSGLDGWFGTAALVGFAVIGLAVAGPVARHGARGWSSDTIYPWWSLVLVAAGMVFAVISGWWRGRAAVALGAAMTGVFAAELAGLGIVAARHWGPANGQIGFPGNERVLQLLGLLIFVTGVSIAVLSLVRLRLGRQLSRTMFCRASWWAVTVGVGVLVLLPVAIGSGDQGHYGGAHVTSYAAYALIYSMPWGLSIAATGWLDDLSARAVLIGCAVCAALALIGPQMTNLVYSQSNLAFCLSLGAVLLALIPRLRRP